MKKPLLMVLVFAIMLAAPLFLRAYDNQPASEKIIPECIWAAASGGGTWITEIQIINRSATSTTGHVNATFYHSGGTWGPFQLTSSEMDWKSTFRTTNLLSLLDTRDTNAAHVYAGTVGAVLFSTTNSMQITVTAWTKNGNYGKSYPGMTNAVKALNSANPRAMTIPFLRQTPADRTFVGFWNSSGLYSYTVLFQLFNSDHVQIGSDINRTLTPNQFIAFNPFTEAGVAAGTYYYDAYLWFRGTQTTQTDWAWGVIGFGSIANSTTNDTTALIPSPEVEPTTSTATVPSEESQL